MCNDTATPQLEELVTTVANQLMTVDAATSAEVSQRVLAYLVEQLGVDVSFCVITIATGARRGWWPNGHLASTYRTPIAQADLLR